MNKTSVLSFCLLTAFVSFAADPPKKLAVPVQLAKPGAVTMADLARFKTDGVAVREVSDYVFGKYQGELPSPPHADLNPKKAFIIFWKNSPFRFVFAHEGSYCPWFELPSGSAVCYQFLEGNLGWAELFNNWGRQERNSFVEIIGLCPVGKRWFDVLKTLPGSEERHALAVLDPFSEKRYDVFWKPKPGTVWDSTHRRAGCDWKEFEHAAGAAFVIPMVGGAPFCVYGDASGFRHEYTRNKEHTFPGTGNGWGSTSWDHWPIGWLNSQANLVNENSLKLYPNHFSPAGMDFFALPNEESARRVYYSLMGVGADNFEAIRVIGRQWLGKGERAIAHADSGADLPPPHAPHR